MKHFTFFVLLLFSFASNAQLTFSTTVIDKNDKTEIPSVVYKVIPSKNIKIKFSGQTDKKGGIYIEKIQPGEYDLILTSVGYDTLKKAFSVADRNVNLGKLEMSTSIIIMKELKVTAKADRVTMKGDTTQFNADAFKVNPDASAEDLLKKMPSIEIENGTIKAQGENVKRVLIDGKEFFGNDPNMALKNLPAEIIDKIEVFDRQSDQSRFSGFDDGNSEKTINILTKSGKSNGEFGKIYAGYGSNDRYVSGGNINYFKGERRISLIGLSNNVNQVNFSSDDLLGALGSGSSGVGGGGRGGQGNRGSSGGGQRGGMPASRGGGTDQSNFLVGNQGGITNTNAIGFNYIDKWTKKIEVSVSYFFNKMGNNAIDSIDRINFTGVNTQQWYNENSFQNNTNLNHKINSRFTYDIDTKNSIVFTPNLSFQANQKFSNFIGKTILPSGENINSISSDQNSDKNAYNLRANLTYRHRFEKRGRTFSIGLGANTQSSNSEGALLSNNKTFFPRVKITNLDQINSDTTVNNGYTLRFDYNEPINKNSQLNFSYQGNFSVNESNKKTFDIDEITKKYDNLNPVLSNSFLNDYNTNAGGISYRYAKMRKTFFSLNLNFQHSELASKQVLPKELEVNRTFFNILPFASFNYQFSNTKNLRIFYRSSARAPSINQLQNVVNNTNPLQLRAGNPDLNQEVSNLLTLRYNSGKPKKGNSFFTFLNAELVQNNISTSVFTAQKDTLFRGLLLAKGSQLSLPVNYGKTWNVRSFMTYSLVALPIKSNVNINLGANYSYSPSLQNQAENISTNTSFTSGLVIGSNISKNVDFTISYSGTYNIINNSLNPALNSDYFSQLISLKLNLLSKKGFFFNTEGVNTNFNSIGDDFDQIFTLFNFSLGQKFLKKKQCELKITAFDVFNQNTNVGRTVNEAYIEDSRSLVLNRYFLMTFTYTIRNFR